MQFARPYAAGPCAEPLSADGELSLTLEMGLNVRSVLQVAGNQLDLVGAVGIEPTTFGLKGRCSTTELRPFSTTYEAEETDVSVFVSVSTPGSDGLRPASTSLEARIRSASLVMLYRSKIERVRWPQISMHTLSGTPALTKLRTAARRKSWRFSPTYRLYTRFPRFRGINCPSPDATHRVYQFLRGSITRLPVVLVKTKPDAKISVGALQAVCGDAGRYGAVVFLSPGALKKAAMVLGAA